LQKNAISAVTVVEISAASFKQQTLQSPESERPACNEQICAATGRQQSVNVLRLDQFWKV
jgi:hypothetical protein